MLRFAINHPGWQGHGSDCRKTLRTLQSHGLVETNSFQQFRLAGNLVNANLVDLVIKGLLNKCGREFLEEVEGFKDLEEIVTIALPPVSDVA